jgi:hypothetical protein
LKVNPSAYGTPRYEQWIGDALGLTVPLTLLAIADEVIE